MRHLFGLLFVPLLVPVPVLAGEGGIHEKPMAVFILAGQSNMVGQGDGSKLPDALRMGHDRVLRWVDGEWQALCPILPASGNLKRRGIVGPTFGPEISFGAEIGKAFPERRIGIVKVAVGETL